METRKIAAACFAGGVICCLVALLVTPAYWWMGLLAGFAGGYLGYEFREALRMIPVAWRVVMAESQSSWQIFLDEKSRAARIVQEWLAEKHVFLYPGALCSLAAAGWVMYCLSLLPPQEQMSQPRAIVSIGFVVMALGMFCFTLVIMGLAYAGCVHVERAYWWPLVERYDIARRVGRLEARDLRRKPLTYLNVLRWALEGVVVVAFFLAVLLWIYIVAFLIQFTWRTVRLLSKFLWHVFKLIHSEKRLLCGVDGALGGGASYLWLVSAAMTPMEQLTMTMFGGLLGAALGVANWEVVSKGLLRVHIKPVH